MGHGRRVCLVLGLVPLLGGALSAQEKVEFDAADIEGSAIKIQGGGGFWVGYEERNIGGRPAVCTLPAKSWHWLVFDVPDDFVYDDDAPLTLTLTYFDQPGRLFEVLYDAQDDLPLRKFGDRARIDLFERTNALEWRTLSYRLPGPKFANRLKGIGDIAVTGHTWNPDPRTGRVAISHLEVSRRHVTVECEPRTVAQGQDDRTVTVTATCLTGHDTPAPDGTEVAFLDSAGRLRATAVADGGKAQTTFEAPAEPGEDWVTAEWEGIPGHANVQTLPGAGPIRETTANIDSFDGDYRWAQPEIEGKGTSSATIDRERVFAGEGALRVDYAFDPEFRGSHVLTIPIEKQLPGRVNRIRFQVYDAHSYRWMSLGLRDRDMEYFWYEIGRLEADDWREFSWDDSYPPVSIIGPADGNRKADLPLTLVGIRLISTGEKEQTRDGTLLIDELEADCDVAEAEQP